MDPPLSLIAYRRNRSYLLLQRGSNPKFMRSALLPLARMELVFPVQTGQGRAVKCAGGGEPKVTGALRRSELRGTGRCRYAYLLRPRVGAMLRKDKGSGES